MSPHPSEEAENEKLPDEAHIGLKSSGSSYTMAGMLKSQRYAQCRTHIHAKQDILKHYRQSDAGSWNLLERLWLDRESQHVHWIDSTQAKAVFYVAILLNILWFILVAYLQQDSAWRSNSSDTRGSESIALQWVYFVVELFFCALFSGELLLRLKASSEGGELTEGIDAWTECGWNRFDAVLVVACFVDACILNFTPSAKGVHRVVVLLMPALQTLRLGRVVSELRLIIFGILSAMKGVFWSMLLLFIVIYFVAVLSVAYMGAVPSLNDDNVRLTLFGTMADSMFTLFTFATLENYTDAVRHFLHSGGGGIFVGICLIAFILFANLALLNLVTAVMVDSIIDILPKKRTEKMVKEKALLVRQLEVLFNKMDQDGNRTITLEEFQRAVADREDVRLELSRLEIASFDVKELFTLIDWNDNGVVSVDEFIEGLLRITPGPAQRKELLGVQYDIHKMWNMLASGQEKLMDFLREELHCRMQKVEVTTMEAAELSAKVADSIEQMVDQRLETLCSKFQDGQLLVLKTIESAGLSRLDARLGEVERLISAFPQVLAEQVAANVMKNEAFLEGQRQYLEGQRSLAEAIAKLQPQIEREQTSPRHQTPRSQRILASVEELRHEIREQRQLIKGRSASPSSASKEVFAEMTAQESPRIRQPDFVSPQSIESSPQDFNKASSVKSFVSQNRTDPSTLTLRPVSAPQPAASGSSVPTLRVPPQRFERTATPPGDLGHYPTSETEDIGPFQRLVKTTTSQAQEPSTIEAQAQYESHGCQSPRSPQGILPPRSEGSKPEIMSPRRPESSMPESLAGPPADHGNAKARVASVLGWVRNQNWLELPFDKLVLNLEQLGIQLSIAEQDLMKQQLQHPGIFS
eukprot:TRINITY_DN40133_c0_g1_i1.p1 TRINITY_DN40133_c0_g1~~TRINITY_DN40133_c0_g1_i1.p1  ORF type:complete len:866 (-),score=130.12 TRINITY_DN40133_c0_g1_i1:170-2767(-)